MTPIQPKPGTQKHSLLEWARRRAWFTNREMVVELFQNSPWKRLGELEADGWQFESRDIKPTGGKAIKQYRLRVLEPSQITLDEVSQRG